MSGIVSINAVEFLVKQVQLEAAAAGLLSAACTRVEVSSKSQVLTAYVEKAEAIDILLGKYRSLLENDLAALRQASVSLMLSDEGLSAMLRGFAR